MAWGRAVRVLWSKTIRRTGRTSSRLVHSLPFVVHASLSPCLLYHVVSHRIYAHLSLLSHTPLLMDASSLARHTTFLVLMHTHESLERIALTGTSSRKEPFRGATPGADQATERNAGASSRMSGPATEGGSQSLKSQATYSASSMFIDTPRWCTIMV